MKTVVMMNIMKAEDNEDSGDDEHNESWDNEDSGDDEHNES